MRVLIDPGHGGDDPGCIHRGIAEKDFNLSLGLSLRNVVRALGIDVEMTRQTDVGLELRERVGTGIYDLVISLHADAAQNPNVRGLVTYAQESNATAFRAGTAIAQYAPGPLRRSIARCTPCTPKDWTKRAYNVLAHHLSPAVLVECGFLTNEFDAEYLAGDVGKWAICASILHGISDVQHGQRRVG